MKQDFVLQGESYYSVLKRMHEVLKPRRYLEIGVSYGQSLSLAHEGTYAVGVDPSPHITYGLRAWTQLYKMPSDLFFAVYQDKPFDLLFIDGLHHFEAVVEDFKGAEECCAPHSIMLFHDTIPKNAETSTQVEDPQFWTGDVWKLVPLLLEYRPDLTIFTIGCPPSGLTVIQGFGKGLGLPQEALEKYQNKEYSWLQGNETKELNIVENTPQVWGSLLS